jgi:hypothetical protein
MAKNGSQLTFAAILSVLICSLSGTVHATEDLISKRQLTQAMAKVRKGETPSVRTKAAKHVAELTSEIDPNNVDDTTLAELVSLLDTSQDSVRLWVAASLGNLGPRAKVAIPTLLKLLPEVDCLRVSLTSAPVIRVALDRMGEIPPPPKCETTGK